MKFSVDSRIFTNVKGLHIGVLVLDGIDNAVDVSDFVKRDYAEVSAAIRHKFEGVELAEYPVIRGWRDIYKGFGEKKARSSIESMIRRIVNGKDLYNINPLVDIYNLASLRHELPCGGEDIDAIPGDMELTYSDGSEKFIPLGETEEDNPNPGEIIYKSGPIAVCRNFNYRENDITKLSAATKRALIFFEDVSGDMANLNSAVDWIAAKATELLGATISAKAIIDEINPSVAW